MATKAPRKQPVKAATAQSPTADAPAAAVATKTAPDWLIAQDAPIEAPVAAAAAVESVVEAVTETVSDIREAVSPTSLKQKGKTMADTIKNMTAEMKTRAEDAVAKGKAYFIDANDFNKGNIEALVESGKIAAKGFEKLGQDAAEYTRKSFEHTTSAFKGMAAVKSPTELLKLHSDYVRSSFDMFVAEASRSTEASLKLAGEIAQPISNRFAVAAEKVKLAA